MEQQWDQSHPATPEGTQHQGGPRTEHKNSTKCSEDPTGREATAEFVAGPLWQSQGHITKGVSSENTTKHLVRARAPLSAGSVLQIPPLQPQTAPPDPQNIPTELKDWAKPKINNWSCLWPKTCGTSTKTTQPRCWAIKNLPFRGKSVILENPGALSAAPFVFFEAKTN